MLGGGLLNRHLYKKTSVKIAIKTYFHFSRYKTMETLRTMETLSCQSSESTYEQWQ